jgi:hypothetical protein
MNIGDWINVVLAFVLGIVTIRDMILNNTETDYSRSNWGIIRWFLTTKTDVVAKRFVRALGFPDTDNFREKVAGKKMHNYKGAITFLKNCIHYAGDGNEFSYGGSGSSHRSSYYVDSMGHTQNKDNCAELCNL